MNSHGNITADRLRAIDRQYRVYRTLLLWLVAVGFVVNGALFWLASEDRPGHALMHLEDPRLLGPAALCPGEALRYELVLTVNGPGVFAVDRAIWRVTPPATVVFSDTRHVIFDEAATFAVERVWTIPDSYIDPATGGRMAWRPGEYEVRHAVSTSSRNTRPSIQVIPFEIRSNCGE